MMNERLINETLKLINDYFAEEGITVSNAILDGQIRSWYNNSEITNAEMLVAAVMQYGAFNPDITWRALEQLRDFYFPLSAEDERERRIREREAKLCEMYDRMREEYENISAQELADARMDAMWQ